MIMSVKIVYKPMSKLQKLFGKCQNLMKLSYFCTKNNNPTIQSNHSNQLK